MSPSLFYSKKDTVEDLADRIIEKFGEDIAISVSFQINKVLGDENGR